MLLLLSLGHRVLVDAPRVTILTPPLQGKSGNAAQYLTRNQAIKKLQLRLSEFR